MGDQASICRPGAAAQRRRHLVIGTSDHAGGLIPLTLEHLLEMLILTWVRVRFFASSRHLPCGALHTCLAHMCTPSFARAFGTRGALGARGS